MTLATMLVTGASGFVGGAVARGALSAGWRVVTTSRRDPQIEGTTHVPWDLDSGPLPASEVPAGVDVVVHAAAFVGEWGKGSAVWRTTVGGTAAVLRSFPEARIVYISTASVYDPSQPQVLVREDAEPAGRYLGPYAQAKAAAERVALSSGRAEVVVLRPHAVYGPGDTTLLPRVLSAVRRDRLLLPGGGDVRHSLTSIDNLVGAVLRASRISSPGRLVVNVADADPVVLREALLELLERRGLGNVRIVGVPVRAAWASAKVLEALYRAAGSARPPLMTRYAISQLAMEGTLDLTVLREQLGFQPAPTSFDGAADW